MRWIKDKTTGKYRKLGGLESVVYDHQPGDLVKVLLSSGTASYSWFQAIVIGFSCNCNGMKWFKVLVEWSLNETVEYEVNEQCIKWR